MKVKTDSDFRKILERIACSGGRGIHEVFQTFALLAACALSVGRREKEYMDEVGRWSPEDVRMFASAFSALVAEMELSLFEDLLGPYYMDVLGRVGQSWGAEFHTPPALCELLGALLPPPSTGPIYFMEPACGAGAMVLAYVNSGMQRKDIGRLRVHATDVNSTACNMCYVNMALYGVPALVVHGNTLTGEVWAAHPTFTLPWGTFSREREEPKQWVTRCRVRKRR